MDDLRVSLHYLISMCLGHPDCGVSLGQWDAEVRQGGEMFFSVQGGVWAANLQAVCSRKEFEMESWVSVLVVVIHGVVWAVLEHLAFW